jgi:hypothetical protein
MGWTELLSGSRRQGGETFMAHEIHNYNGPADGDYARYVEQLLASAAAQRQVHADMPAALRDAREAPGRPRISASGAPVPPHPVSTAPRSQAVEQQKSISALLPWTKLLPFALWLLVVVAMVFWQGAAPWLIGMLIVGGMLFKGGRKALTSKVLPGKKP